MTTTETAAPSNFIRHIIDEDLASGKHQTVVTRFPPEPNGYLHIGHAKSICLNFGLARDYGGLCHLRMDDTNPMKEDQAYIDAIVHDVRWLGFDWGDKLFYASDYFDRMYAYAVDLIKQGKAYVCELTPEEVRAYRGTLTKPGQASPYRDRSVEENLDLFDRMRQGEFPDGSKTLRAKIDMASPNINLRDPAMYRIRHAHHPKSGDKWCIYPMYDYAHCLEDAIECITHSICTLEFEDHRPLYDWYLDQLDVPSHPQQIEFARLNLSYTIMSKRKLLELVENGLVSGWDDPRMPTIAGFRRRGYTPAAIRDFADRIGVAKADNLVDVALLEHCIRDDLNQEVKRAMAVLRPLKVVITNLEQDEEFDAPYFPDDPPRMGTRKVPFTREIYIEQDDFMEEPPNKFFRLAPGREVRLRWAYFIKCQEVIKDAGGNVVELRCTYDPETKGGHAPDGRKVKGTIHWVSASDSVEAEVRLYDRLFSVADVDAAIKDGGDYQDFLNPGSLETVTARVEKSLAGAQAWERFQFERQGYFMVDPEGGLVFNRIVPLKDSWSKLVQAGKTS